MMRSLYESILGNDFDINDKNVKQVAAREIVIQSNYGQDDVEIRFSPGGNQITIDYPGGEREFILDELVDGLKQCGVGIVEFKKDCRLKYPPKILSNMDIVGYGGIKFNAPIYNRKPEKIQLKDMNIVSFGSMYIYSTDLDLDSKTKLDCSNLNLMDSILTIKARTQLTTNEIRIINPGHTYKLRMKKAGLLKLYEGERNFDDYDFTHFTHINPTELFFGQQIKSVYKIVITPEIYTVYTGLVFIKGGMVLPRSHVKKTFDMKDNWVCYVCDKVSYDIY